MKKSNLIKTAASSALFSSILLGASAVAADEVVEAPVTPATDGAATVQAPVQDTASQAPTVVAATATSEPVETAVVTAVPSDYPTVELPEAQLPAEFQEGAQATEQQAVAQEQAVAPVAEARVQPASVVSTNQTGGTWSTSGKKTTYKDASGNLVQGRQTIDGKDYFFGKEYADADEPMDDQKGIYLAKGTVLKDGAEHYFYAQPSGEFLKNGFSDQSLNVLYYADANGYLKKGSLTVDGKHYYIKDNYSINKGELYTRPDGKQGFADPETGEIATNKWLNTAYQGSYYATADGSLAIGLTSIDGKSYYFDETGKQVKSGKVTAADGKVYQINKDGVAESFSQAQGFFTGSDGRWYYLESNGQVAKGTKVINGKTLFFNENGQQIKGQFAKAEDGQEYYYDYMDGHRVTGTFVREYNYYRNDGVSTETNFWYYVDANGHKVTGTQTIDGKTLFFDTDGRQIKGEFAVAEDGKEYYYDAKDGHRVTNDYVTEFTYVHDPGASYGRQYSTHNWYYVDAKGQKLKGDFVINGESVRFDPVTGLQNQSYTRKVN